MNSTPHNGVIKIVASFVVKPYGVDSLFIHTVFKRSNTTLAPGFFLRNNKHFIKTKLSISSLNKGDMPFMHWIKRSSENRNVSYHINK